MMLALARVLGRCVPEDLSVVGFDDSEQASLPYLDLTTLAQDPCLLWVYDHREGEARRNAEEQGGERRRLQVGTDAVREPSHRYSSCS